MSRRVRSLEESLGIRLVERGGHKLRLTPEGEVLHARTSDPFGEIAQVVEELKSGIGRPRGVLRISAPLLFSHIAMGRIGAAFLRAHPDVQLEVTAEDRLVDLVEDGYDIVIRFNPPTDDKLVGRRFLKDQLVLVAPPGLSRPQADEADSAVQNSRSLHASVARSFLRGRSSIKKGTCAPTSPSRCFGTRRRC